MEKREKFILWCDKAMAFSFYALIYFLPISIALSEIFTGTAFFFYLLKRGTVFYGFLKNKDQAPNNVFIFFRKFGQAFKPVPSMLNIPIAFILIISLVSVVRSQYLLLSVEGFVGKVLQSAFLYFNFIECMRSRKRLKIFITIFFISCTLICINGLYQSGVGHGFIHGHIFDGQISSSFRHANDFAAYLIVIIPILFCFIFLTTSQKRDESGKTDEFIYSTHYRIKIACLILFLLVFVCLGLTYSRGAWVGFILSLVLMSLIGLRNRKIIISYFLLIVFFLAVFYPGTPFMKIFRQGFSLSTQESPPLSTQASPPLEVSSPSTSTFELDREEHLQQAINEKFHMNTAYTFLVSNNRLGYWRRSFKIMKDYPMFGCGLNTYALVEGRYDIGWGGYPHNSYLQMAAEIGVVGISIFLWMLFVLFRDSIRALRLIELQTNKILLFGFLTGLLGFLIHSFFDTNFYSVQLSSFMWVIMGVIVALQKIEKA